MTTNTQNSEAQAYEHVGRKRLALPTHESAIDLDEATVADRRASIEVEESSYPRLAWKRGREADDVSVMHGPLYVHEKVNAVGFLNSMLKDSETIQSDMFSTFNGTPDGAVFEPYRHSGNWTNRLVRAPSQRMMASLLEREGMRGKVDMVYMDPPYNIDFRSNWQGLIDDLNVTETLESVPYDLEQVKAFRDSYKNGVHSYLDQLRLQLVLAKALLSDTGSMFLQIGAGNLHVAAMLMSEVFGHEHHVATIPYVTSLNYSTRLLPEIGNWLVWFAKDKSQVKYHQLHEEASDRADKISRMGFDVGLELSNDSIRPLTRREREDPDKLIPAGARLFQRLPLDSAGHSTTGRSESWTYNSTVYPCPTGNQWRVSHEGMDAIAAQGRMDLSTGKNPRWILYEDELLGTPISANNWVFRGDRNKTYVVQTPQAVIEQCILMTTDPGDLILDPTCGSGTSAIAAEKWGRRWITSDSSEVAVAVARQRLLAQHYDWYILQDSAEGARLEHELSGGEPAKFVSRDSYGEDPSRGSVYERQRRLSARMLAYDIHEYFEFVDRPRIKSDVQRLTSSFTVESDSPYIAEGPEPRKRDESSQATRERVLSGIVDSGLTLPGGSHFTVGNFEEYAGDYLSHKGIMVSEQGDERRAMFHIVDEDMVLSRSHIIQARREALLSGENPDVLVIVTFAREAKAVDNMLSQGGLDVYVMLANRDLMIPQLDNGKTKGTRTRFVLVSEPDLTVLETSEGRLRIRVNRLDVYNADAGQVEPSDMRRVSCMMVDTDFNDESFFARRVNFPNRTRAYESIIERMRTAFNSQIDNDKWEMMKSATTVPFDRPESGLLAVKVIDHTGTEHEKIIDLNNVLFEPEK